MDESREHGWLEQQIKEDQRSSKRSLVLLGPERATFSEVMFLLTRLWDSALTADDINKRIEELALKHQLALLNYGINLLWAAWNEALAGRYHTASDHFRSIAECPEFLLALSYNPQLSNEWTDDKDLDIATVRRTIKNHAGKHPKDRDELLKQMRDAAKGVQPLAHVSVHSIGRYLSLAERDGKAWLLARPGGAVSRTTLRLVSIQLALSALELFATALVVLDDLVKTDLDLLEKTAAHLRERMLALSGETKALSSEVRAPLGGIYFARTDEDT